MTTLHIQGMHCGACAQLIRMELEDNQICSDAFIITNPTSSSLGTITLTAMNHEQTTKIIGIINAMETYQVVNPS